MGLTCRPMHHPSLTPTATMALLCWGLSAGTTTVVHAQQDRTLDTVVISASRQEQQSFDAPASVQAVDQTVIQSAGPMVNLSESAIRIPGVVVLKAQLYGNAAGGVLQVFTADGPEPAQLQTTLDLGPQRFQRVGLQLAGHRGDFNYRIDHSDFSTEGWRVNSQAARVHTNARLRWTVSEQTRLTLVANVFDQPVSGDPLGLTRQQVEENPRQAVLNATQYRAGKSVSQSQIGWSIDHRLDRDSDVSARFYLGQRDLDNRLSIPLVVQQSPTAAGGVVQLDRQFGGLGVRYAQRRDWGEGQIQWTLGLDVERMNERRRGFINDFGVVGALKRDEDNAVSSLGLYTQVDWAVSENWSVVAGVRANEVQFSIQDFFIRPDNPDDSGRVRFTATNPVIGFTRHIGSDLNLYANVGRGFETPTFTEIAYTADSSGPNLGLRPAISTHLEVGVKARVADGHRVDAAVFRIDTRDEIVVASSIGGRSVFRNAGDTRRQGFELSYAGQWSPAWRSHLAFTAIQAKFRQPFVSSSNAVVNAGNRIPGVLDRFVFGEIVWQHRPDQGWEAALEWVYQGSMAVNDLNVDRTAPSNRFNLRLAHDLRRGPWTLRQTLRVENLTDRSYIGSVIANESNSRFFEPAPGRQWFLGWTLSRTL